MTKKQAEFVFFLEDTLIPDLIDSGYEATAEDFEEGILHLRNITSGDSRMHYRTEARRFIKFLRDTLIPDLKDTGMVETAKDFMTLSRMIDSELKRR